MIEISRDENFGPQKPRTRLTGYALPIFWDGRGPSTYDCTSDDGGRAREGHTWIQRCMSTILVKVSHKLDQKSGGTFYVFFIPVAPIGGLSLFKLDQKVAPIGTTFLFARMWAI